MREVSSTVTSKGQVTIPVAVRRHLGLHEGDTLTFVINNEGLVELHVPKYPSVAALRGAAGSLPQPLSWQEMRRIAHEDRWHPSGERE
jgi:antitoxin PrlF